MLRSLGNLNVDSRHGEKELSLRPEAQPREYMQVQQFADLPARRAVRGTSSGVGEKPQILIMRLPECSMHVLVQLPYLPLLGLHVFEGRWIPGWIHQEFIDGHAHSS